MPELPIHQWIEALKPFYDQFGYLIVLLGAFGENTVVIGFFLPGNSLVLLGAAYAHLGNLNLGLVIAWAILGTIIGYHCDYLLGRFLLSGLIGRLCTTRIGQHFHLGARLRMGARLLKKHGGKAILISHVSSQLRSFIAISAGFTRMPYRTFLFFEVIAATLWNTAFAMLGYFVAVQVDQLEVFIQRFGIISIVILLVIYLAWRYLSPGMRERTRKRLYRARMRREKERVGAL